MKFLLITPPFSNVHGNLKSIMKLVLSGYRNEKKSENSNNLIQ